MRQPKTFSALAALALMIVIFDPTRVPARQGPPEQPDMTIDAATRKEVIENLSKRLNSAYVFPETAAKMEQHLRERLAKGEYDKLASAKEFAAKLTEDLQAVSRDKHLRVRYSHRPIPENGGRREPTAEEQEQQRRFLMRVNHGFEKVERLQGNVGYLDFRFFGDEKAGAETVAAAFNFLSNTDAIIIDMRQNGGGNPAMVALVCSYLFGAEPVHLNSLYWREGDRTEEFWTQKEVAGKRYTGKDVYVLTSQRTFSGAEEFSYNLKNLKRATIIGETTGGGAHPGGGNRLHAHFGAFIPTGRAINPITKTNWEGTGVEPDVKVPADQALKVAHLSAVKRQLEKEKDEDVKAALRRLADTLQKELNETQAKK
jgi:retinol-binding protein 3